MENQFQRTEMLIGKKAIEQLKNAKVIIFGIGGVGSYVAEGLARTGIGELVLVDKDIISLTNLNRQIHATYKTIGKPKVEVMRERILQINKQAKVEIYQECYLPENEKIIIDNSYSYVVDAVDMVTAKLEIIKQAKKVNVPVISCMGTGNKLNPMMLEVADIAKTSVCPLAKRMRKELRNCNIQEVKVLYSKEEPKKVVNKKIEEERVPGSIAFVPSVAGLIIASEIVKDLLKKSSE